VETFYRIEIINNGMMAVPVECEEDGCIPDGEECVRKDNTKTYCKGGLSECY